MLGIHAKHYYVLKLTNMIRAFGIIFFTRNGNRFDTQSASARFPCSSFDAGW